MQVEQAVFTSAQTARMRGYQLVAQSAGLDDRLVRELSRWCPTQSALASDDAGFESLNCFPLDDHVAVTRTVYGGPEYSGRGDLQTVTMILLVGRQQLAGYDFNPLYLAQTALTFGQLRLRLEDDPSLPHVSLPDHMPLTVRPPRGSLPQDFGADLKHAVTALGEKRRVAIVGAGQPLEILAHFLNELSPADRAALSFTTGLVPSSTRPFQLHFLPAIDTATHNQLASQRVERISCSQAGPPAREVTLS